MKWLSVVLVALLGCIQPTYKGAIVAEWVTKKDYCVGLGFTGSERHGHVSVVFAIQVGTPDTRGDCKYRKGEPYREVHKTRASDIDVLRLYRTLDLSLDEMGRKAPVGLYERRDELSIEPLGSLPDR